MPRINRERIGIAFDIQGCPNRCRHCYLGSASRGKLSENDVQWGARQFRDFLEKGTTPIKSLSISTWFREPNFSDDYKHLHELEAELSDGKPERYELLSIWRLTRDKDYANWAKSIGPDICQISFFGVEETNDWFYRRRGAFKDALTATERLLEIGMKPRWQLFLTKKMLPEIDELLSLISHLRLHERVRLLGKEFQFFMHLPGPDHEARKIEYLRPTMEETADLLKEMLKTSRKHFGKETLWQPESELYVSILKNGEEPPSGEEILPEVLWFFVTNNWDVFTNLGTLEEWWRLGNMKEDSVETIICRFEHDEVLGLKVLLLHPPKKLAEEYGNPRGGKIYSGKDDLLSLYRGEHCEKIWRRR